MQYLPRQYQFMPLLHGRMVEQLCDDGKQTARNNWNEVPATGISTE